MFIQLYYDETLDNIDINIFSDYARRYISMLQEMRLAAKAVRENY